MLGLMALANISPFTHLGYMTARVVVGSDASALSQSAVTWAAAEADRRGAELHVVGPCPDHDAARILIEEAADADLIVVGSAGVGRSHPLGSVVRAVLRSSPCPVAVVPPGRERERCGRVVFGLDGSPPAMDALEWAADEAHLLRAELVVVHAWWHGRGDNGLGSAQARDFARVDAALVMETAIDACHRRGAELVRGELIEGRAAQAILGLAEHADLVVVGSRGERASRSMLFGSVAQAVLESSPCPVVSYTTRCVDPHSAKPNHDAARQS